MKRYLSLTVLAMLISLSWSATAGPTSFKSESKHDSHSSQRESHRYERYRYKYDDDHRYYREKKKQRYSRKHRRHDPGFLYVLPKGSRIVIINGSEYYRWQNRHYLSGYYKGDRVFIAVDL